MTIHASLAARGVPCTVGVTTGQVYCGYVGSAQRKEYAMVGDVVNLSARLMCAAEKLEAAVLCDQRTRDGAVSNVLFHSLGSIAVKGKSQPIEIYHPQGRRLKQEYAISPLPRMFGRASILADIGAALESLHTGASNSILIESREGLGKSLLVSHALAKVHELAGVSRRSSLPIHTVTSQCFAMEQALPFYWWKVLVRDQLGLLSAGAPDEPRVLAETAALTQALVAERNEAEERPIALAQSIRLISNAKSLSELSRSPLTNVREHESAIIETILDAFAEEPTQLEHAQTLMAMVFPHCHRHVPVRTLRLSVSRRLARATVAARILSMVLGRRPTFLVVEELQCIDAMSLSALSVLIKTHRPLFVLGTTRSKASVSDLAPHFVCRGNDEPMMTQSGSSSNGSGGGDGGASRGSVVRLQPLTPEESLQYACHLLGLSEIPEPHSSARSRIDAIVEDAHGNPLFLSEHIRALLEARTLTVTKDGECLVGEDHSSRSTGSGASNTILDEQVERTNDETYARAQATAAPLPDSIMRTVNCRIDRSISSSGQMILKVGTHTRLHLYTHTHIHTHSLSLSMSHGNKISHSCLTTVVVDHSVGDRAGVHVLDASSHLPHTVWHHVLEPGPEVARRSRLSPHADRRWRRLLVQEHQHSLGSCT